MKLSIRPVSWKFKVPLTTAHGVVAQRHAFELTIRDEDGAGEGEASPLEMFGTESAEAAHQALQQWRAPGSLDSLEAIYAATRVLAATPAARCGLEMALLDRLARQQGQSIAHLLTGNPVGRRLAVNALIDGESAAELARDAEAKVAAGFRVLKIKVAARPLSVDAQRLMAVRKAVGPDIALRIDANGGWSEAGARTALRGMEALKLELCEQPVRATDLEGFSRVRAQVPTRLAADEALLNSASHRRILGEIPEGSPDARPAVADVLVLKPMALGGLLTALELAQRAQTRGIAAYVTTLLDGPRARAAAAQLAAALPDHGWAHGLSTVELFEGLPVDPFSPVSGAIRVGDAVGLGLSP